ncbi:RNase H domain-containing protein [Hirsutella rhossiliensis]|uniref:RNase H domain-containing protein n=1 Tax=Hirsutella rhossiliensis TaxID=111463 RepID=A0A9P8N4K9_9HYPO|nr:RNase H domain-containing protein [Hirsutella rhossiliensis]KAH0966842.1 RNase H domain-containing protein [Hirsutella rhossiliensis]
MKVKGWLRTLSPRTLVTPDTALSFTGTEPLFRAAKAVLDLRRSSTLRRQFQSLAREHGAVEIRWIPGHADIPGNEEADALAKAGASLPEPADNTPTLAHLRRIARQQPKVAFKAWWETSAPKRYKELGLNATTSCPPELTLSRNLLHHLLAAGTHHGDFADYHKRFAPTHIFYCRKIAPHHRLRLGPSPAAAVSRALGDDFDKFVRLVKASSFFVRTCPRH